MNTVAHERQLARPAGSFFGALPPVGGDPIFALNDEFRRDPRAFKANLGIGVYGDDEGRVPMLGSVKKAAPPTVSITSIKSISGKRRRPPAVMIVVMSAFRIVNG